jgi:hypothetical protein
MRGVSTPSAPASASRSYVYERRRPESTTLHRVVRENLATLYAAVEQGFASPLPAFVKHELEGYLACGVLARGFAILQCENADCRQKKLVAFSCKGRGFCPSCMGRRMAETAANLVDQQIARRGWSPFHRLRARLLPPHDE